VGRRRSASKQRWLDSVHKLYISGDEEKLYKLLRPVIESKARMYARRWKWTGITEEDFCSEFWEVAWNLYERPYQHSKYTFYETFELAVRRKVINMVRHVTLTRQGSFEHGAVQIGEKIADVADSTDMETTVINRLYVQSILTDKRLSPADRQLLQTIYRNPDSSFQQIAQMVGLRWSQQVIRRLDGIRRRLTNGESDRTDNPGAKTELSV
jgi:predicted transcriptional regulator